MATPHKTKKNRQPQPKVRKTSQRIQTAVEHDDLNKLVAIHKVAGEVEHPAPSDILAMQKTVGNQAVQRFLARQSAASITSDEKIVSPGNVLTTHEPLATSQPAHSTNGKREAAAGSEDTDKVKSEAAKDTEDEDKVKSEAAKDTEDEDKVKSETKINWESPTVSYQADNQLVEDKTKSEDVSWPAATYTSSTANGSSTCVEKPFRVTYADADTDTDWKIKVGSISGGATITVKTGGSTNPITSPPGTEEKAKEAVKDMKGYYKRGTRGDWHTEAASSDHEHYHYREWKETCNHYWPKCQEAIEKLTVSKSAEKDKAKARAKLEEDANKKVADFSAKSRKYWMTLGDGAGDRPYAAGQLKLNDAVKSVQELAKNKSWTVEQGTDSPSTENPCYQPWLPYTP